MRNEVEYRRLLEKAQEATETIETLLAALRTAPHVNSSIEAKAARISASLNVLQAELDQLWDEFKRA